MISDQHLDEVRELVAAQRAIPATVARAIIERLDKAEGRAFRDGGRTVLPTVEAKG